MKNQAAGKRICLAVWIPALLALAACGDGDTTHPSGTLEATTVDLATTLTGKVLQVRVDRGDDVAEGDTLVLLDTELLALQLQQSRAGLEQLEAKLSAADDAIAQAREQERLAATTLRRIASLHEQGNLPEQRLDEARTNRELASLRLAGAESERRALAAEGKRIEATLALQRRTLEDGVLTAPMAGRVLTRAVEPGEVLRAGATALRMANLAKMELRIYLDVTDIDRLRLGQQLPVRVDALEGETLQATLRWISDEAEFTPKNVQTREQRSQLVYAVELELSNEQGRLHIGMPAELQLPPPEASR